MTTGWLLVIALIILSVAYLIIIIMLFNMNKKLQKIFQILHVQWKQAYLKDLKCENENSSDIIRYYKQSDNAFIYELEDIEYLMKKINENAYYNLTLPKTKLNLKFLTRYKNPKLKENILYQDKYDIFKFIDEQRKIYKLETLLEHNKFIFIDFEELK